MEYIIWISSIINTRIVNNFSIIIMSYTTFNNFSVKGIFAKYDDRYTGAPDGETLEHTYGLGMAYQWDAILVEGFYRRDGYEYTTAGVDDEDYDSFGIGAEYDLGGGAVLAGGIIDTDYLDDTVADFGIKFSF